MGMPCSYSARQGMRICGAKTASKHAITKCIVLARSVRRVSLRLAVHNNTHEKQLRQVSSKLIRASSHGQHPLILSGVICVNHQHNVAACSTRRVGRAPPVHVFTSLLEYHKHMVKSHLPQPAYKYRARLALHARPRLFSRGQRESRCHHAR